MIHLDVLRSHKCDFCWEIDGTHIIPCSPFSAVTPAGTVIFGADLKFRSCDECAELIVSADTKTASYQLAKRALESAKRLNVGGEPIRAHEEEMFLSYIQWLHAQMSMAATGDPVKETTKGDD